MQLVHSDAAKRVILHIRTGNGFESANEYLQGGTGGVNWPVNNTGGDDDEDFLDMTVVSLTSDLVVRIECVADDSVANMPVTCVAFKSKP